MKTQLINFFRHPNVKHFLGIFITFLTIYSFTASPFASGYADSDEFIVSGHLWSVAHPPGYPLLTAFSWLFQHLLFWTDPAHASNILNSFLQASAMGMFSLLVFQILQLASKTSRDNIINRLTSILASVIIGLSVLFWHYATVIEVGSLSNLLLTSALLSAITWWHQLKQAHVKTAQNTFFLTCALFGLALSHLQVVIVAGPTFSFLLILGLHQHHQTANYLKPKIIAFGLFALLLGFILPNLLLFSQNAAKPDISWQFPQTLSGWSRHILRQDYQGFFVDEGRSRTAYTGGLGHNWLAPQDTYLRLQWEQLGLIGLLLLLMGAVHVLSINKFQALIWLSFAIIAGPIFTGIMGIPDIQDAKLEYELGLGVLSRQFFPGQIAYGILIAWGISWLMQELQPNQKSNKQSKRNLIIISSTFIGFISLYLFWRNYPVANQQSNNIVADYALTLLEQIDPNAVIICSSDVSCYSLFAAQSVDNIRPDVVVLSKNNKYRRYFLDRNPEYYGLLYPENPFFFAGLISWNLHQQRPVYLTNPDTNIIDYLGLDGNPWYLVPRGYVYQVVTSLPQDFDLVDTTQQTTNWFEPVPDFRDHFRVGLQDYFANIYYFNGLLLTKYGQINQAQHQLETSLSLRPEYQDAMNWLQWLNEPGTRYPQLKEASPSAQILIAQANTHMAQNQLEPAYAALQKASFIEPTNTSIRLQLAKLYLEYDYPEFAEIELQTILIHDPQNKTAKDLYSLLKDKQPTN